MIKASKSIFTIAKTLASDWTHQLSKAPMLKAQHPGYEIYLTGTHASRGVSCADCHMPYISEGGQKFTSHHIVSPLKNVSNSCQVCHREETEHQVRCVCIWIVFMPGASVLSANRRLFCICFV